MAQRSKTPKLTKRETLLALHLQAEKILTHFLRRCARPRQRYAAVEKALEEINHERLILHAELLGTVEPGTRRFATTEPA